MKARVRQDYAQRRRQEYPSIEDQLDALWSFVGSLPPAQLPDKARDTLQLIERIKRKYAKPTKV